VLDSHGRDLGPNVTFQWLVLQLHIRGTWIQILVWTLAIVINIFHAFFIPFRQSLE